MSQVWMTKAKKNSSTTLKTPKWQFIEMDNFESGEDSSFGPRNGHCFVEFAQLPEPTSNTNMFIRGTINVLGGI